MLENVIDSARALGCTVYENEPMERHTTFRIGGPCRALIDVPTASALSELTTVLRGKEYIVIGNGSNLLVRDKGYSGVVLRLSGGFTEIRLHDDNTIYAGAGASLAAVCSFALEKSLTGLEFAYGIHGSVGGAVFMNAGAYGGEMSDVVLAAEYIENGTSDIYDSSELLFGYRHSIFRRSRKIVTAAIIRLAKGDRFLIREKMDELAARRRDKQPLQLPSAGSTFKRPEGTYASYLIDRCGLRGLNCGGAQVSDKHCGFIVNRGGATCEDVEKLMDRIQYIVNEQTGIMLEPEVLIIGDE